MIVKESHFDTELTNRRVVYWLQFIGASIGNDVSLNEYMIWINEQATVFRQEMNVVEHTPLTSIVDGQNKFDVFLKEKLQKRKCRIHGGYLNCQ